MSSTTGQVTLTGLRGRRYLFWPESSQYDAMKADRPYRTGRTMEFMIGELKRCSGTQFDPKVVEAFLNVIGEREEFKMAAS